MSERDAKPRSKRWLFFLIAGLLLVGTVFAAGAWFAGRGERTAAALADSYAQAYVGRDTPKDIPILLPLYAEDAVFHDAARNRTNQGVSAIETALNTLLATPEFDLSIDRTLTGNDWATLFWTADGALPDSGRVAQVTGITVLEISKGKIVSETWYYDPAKAPF
ncbi:MAG: nuclear transport factor 2 family protein [Actinomycetota bacterium]|nr:nuclear transport factor 2 family protein [Actinomycetota bacterium]MDZ4181219.1 nuclear transport factor 2 family protein [Coriobacteriia bacterium]